MTKITALASTLHDPEGNLLYLIEQIGASN